MESRKSGATPYLFAAFFLLVTLLTVAGLLARPGNWRPAVASEHGAGVDNMITYLLCAAGVIFVGGHLVLAMFVLKGKRQDGPAYKAMSRKSEILFTAGPVVFMVLVSEIGVAVLGNPVWGQIFTRKRDDIQVEIVAKQFEWLARYPGKDGKFGRRDAKFMDDVDNPIGLDPKDKDARDDIVMRGQICVPAGRGVWCSITSWDVLHSFNVPVLRTKQDAVPGIHARTRFVATAPGKYEIACAEICGPAHYAMKGFLLVKSREEFEKWLDAQTGQFE